jgi:hypothetical protein
MIVSHDNKVVVIPKGEGRNPGHGPEHDFLVTVLKTDHPITKGLPNQWLHPQEQLTHGQHGPAKNLTVLSYAHSKDTGDKELMDWVIPYGQGRVYVTMLGHLWQGKPDDAMRCIGFQTTLIRGCEWAATGSVTCAVPDDFPTATEMRLRAQATMKKSDDRIVEMIHAGGTTYGIRSPSGIGGATIRRATWPKQVRLRLHLAGLESLSISNGSVTIEGSVLSHSGNRRLLSVRDRGQEKSVKPGSRYWTEIQAFDAMGNLTSGLPAAGGYFEVAIPQVLLEGPPDSLTIGWIDFYRQ